MGNMVWSAAVIRAFLLIRHAMDTNGQGTHPKRESRRISFSVGNVSHRISVEVIFIENLTSQYTN